MISIIQLVKSLFSFCLAFDSESGFNIVYRSSLKKLMQMHRLLW